MCPVCKRDLAPTLSICLTCGAMIHDTVREELETKISKTAPAIPKPTPSRPAPSQPAIASGNLVPPKPEVTAPPMQPPPISSPPLDPLKAATPQPPPVSAPKVATPQPPPMPASKPIAARFDTSNLGVKKTSPTLVEFQTKKATVPEWRLQLQNTVRQKAGTNRRTEASGDESKTTQPRATNGANALKVEFVEEEQPRHQNPRVANALKRIEESRRTFLNHPVPEQPVNIGGKASARNYPFNVVARSNEQPKPRAGQKAITNASPKPMLVSPLKIEKKKYDTNKLPPLAKPVKHVEALLFDDVPTVKDAEAARARWENLSVEDPVIDEVVDANIDPDEIEDLAPFSMRFAAAVFDLIVGVFASFILLSPFILSGGDWLTVSGGLAVLASFAIVMFLYLTISIAFVGRSLGMKLFSLELVDIEENAYPTLHQAAVNSAVFLLSLAFAGLGFLTVFFNEERRAAHDILSGTILVREY